MLSLSVRAGNSQVLRTPIWSGDEGFMPWLVRCRVRVSISVYL